MYWVIRGTDNRTNNDFEFVVEATCAAAAEMWALKRNIPFVIIAEATEDDIARAAAEKRLTRYSPQAKYTCFGRPVMPKQLVALMLCGVWTIAMLMTRMAPAKPSSRTILSRDTRPATQIPGKHRAGPHASAVHIA